MIKINKTVLFSNCCTFFSKDCRTLSFYQAESSKLSAVKTNNWLLTRRQFYHSNHPDCPVPSFLWNLKARLFSKRHECYFLIHGHREGGFTASSKSIKPPFLRGIEKSFQEATPMGPEPHQFLFFWNISTNMVAWGIQSFGQNGP